MGARKWRLLIRQQIRLTECGLNAPTSNPVVRAPLVVGCAIGLVVVGLALGLMLVVGCSENLHPNTDRARMCDTMQGRSGFTWWFAVLCPALVLLASQVVPWFRRHALLTAVSILVVTVAGWSYVLLIVSSNIGDTTISS